jgi:hypothetical protein
VSRLWNRLPSYKIGETEVMIMPSITIVTSVSRIYGIGCEYWERQYQASGLLYELDRGFFASGQIDIAMQDHLVELCATTTNSWENYHSEVASTQ